MDARPKRTTSGRSTPRIVDDLSLASSRGSWPSPLLRGLRFGCRRGGWGGGRYPLQCSQRGSKPEWGEVRKSRIASPRASMRVLSGTMSHIAIHIWLPIGRQHGFRGRTLSKCLTWDIREVGEGWEALIGFPDPGVFEMRDDPFGTVPVVSAINSHELGGVGPGGFRATGNFQDIERMSGTCRRHHESPGGL